MPKFPGFSCNDLGCLTSRGAGCDRQQPLAHDASEVRPCNQLLSYITALCEGDGVEAIQIVLQGYR